MPSNVYSQRGQQSGIDTMPGLYRGRVEYNKDPHKIGRVRVRIPTLHGVPGDDKCLEFDKLPWASPCTPFACGTDYGTFVVPEVGSYVWVMFEAGDTSRPVYIGSMHATDCQHAYPMGTMDSSKDPCTKKYKQSKGEWVRPAYRNEVPQDAIGDSEEFPVSVLYKSPKGATIEIDEEDENETMSFMDRLGQILTFICPVTFNSNNYNSSRRGKGRADKGTNLDTESVSVQSKALVLLKGARDQFLRLVSKKGACRSELVSKDEGNSVSGLGLESGKKRTILFSSKENNACYIEQDSSGNTMELVVIIGGQVQSRITLGSSISLWSTGSITSSPYNPPQGGSLPWEDQKDEDSLINKS